MIQRMIKILAICFIIMVIPGTAQAAVAPTPTPSVGPTIAPSASPKPSASPTPTVKPEVDYTGLLSLSEASITTTVGKTHKLTLQGIEKGESYTEVWSSENNSIVSIDQSGNVTARATTSEAGVKIYNKVTINGRNFEVSCVVYVSEPALVSSSTTLRVGKSEQINVLGLLAQSVVSYKTSDPGIVLVSETGLMTALKTGQCDITIDVDDVRLTYHVIVTNAKVNCTWFLTRVGKTKQLSVSGQSGTTPVTYVSTNTSIASVSKTGLIKAKKRGNAYVTINVDGMKLTCVVNITYKKALSVINSGKKKLGVKYSQARRMSSRYFDCSSFVHRMYKKQKIYFGSRGYSPTAAAEAKYMVRTKKVIAYKYVDPSKLLPGDVLFIKGKYNGRYRNICHTAIYIGNGKILHSTPPCVKYGEYATYKSRISVIARPCK